MLGLSEPRIDARVQAYASVSVCVRVISTCARDKALTRSSMRIQGLSECTIGMFDATADNCNHMVETLILSKNVTCDG